MRIYFLVLNVSVFRQRMLFNMIIMRFGFYMRQASTTHSENRRTPTFYIVQVYKTKIWMIANLSMSIFRQVILCRSILFLRGCSLQTIIVLHLKDSGLTCVLSSLWSHLGVREIEAEALADWDDNQTPRYLIFRQIKRQGKAASGTAGLVWKAKAIINY